MDATVPCPEDHLGLFIYVKLCGYGSGAGSPNSGSTPPTGHVNFNKVMEMLKRFGAVNVADNPPRYVVPNFVTNLVESKVAWGEFQMHRKILGLIAVNFFDESNSDAASPSSSSSSSSSTSTLLDISKQYSDLKETFRSTLIDSRCVLFGSTRNDNLQQQEHHAANDASTDGGILKYANFDDFKRFESDIRDYVKVLFWVLESRRLDSSFEQSDSPPCPMAPDEEKYFVGIDKSSRSYRKRCVGRLRKQLADSTLMTGFPMLALEAYNLAIDALKSVNDWLWLAGAMEGYACAAIIIKFHKNIHQQPLRRVPTFTSGQIKQYSSQEDENASTNFVQKSSKTLTALDSSSPKNNTPVKVIVSTEDIEEKIKSAIDNYRRRLISLDGFLREYCCARFLNEEYKYFDDLQKAQICLLIANVYKKVGFDRKCAFYLRLSALFRLHSETDASTSSIEYRQVYPILLASMDGYGLSLTSKTESSPAYYHGGWPTVRLRALHELFVAAQRAQYRDASIRHLIHFIHAMLEYLDESTLRQFCTDLKQISLESIHVAHIPLSVGNNILLPPISLVKLPKILHFYVRPLPAYLLPKEMIVNEADKIFIYSPFQNIASKKVLWVVGCTCVVEAKVKNLLPVELEVKKLVVQCEGVDYDVSPMMLVLPPKSDVVSVKLLIIPRSPGVLSISGYSCEVLNVKTFCRIDDLSWLRNKSPPKVDVVASLPELSVSTTLPRAKNSAVLDPTEVSSAEICLFSGQKSCQNILLQNKSSLHVSHLECEIKQPAVSGGPSLVELATNLSSATVGPKDSVSFDIVVNGVDPLAVVDELCVDEGLRKVAQEEMIKSIPYTGRLLVASVRILYIGGEGNVKCQRTCSLSLYITILPVVVIVDWHVLPGESSTTRYLALDVINACDSEVDIEFALDKLVTVQPKDICRVPVLCDCCQFDDAVDLPVARGPLAKQYLLAARRKMLQKHLLNQLDVRWKLASGETGSVPLGYFMKSLSVRDDLVISPLSVDVSINGMHNSAIDYFVAVGDVNSLKLQLSSFKDLELMGKVCLTCYQDLQNGLTILSEQMLIVGPRFYSVLLNDKHNRFEATFEFSFTSEGVYKLEIKFDVETSLYEKEMDWPFSFPLLPIYTFNVCSKFI